MQFLTIKTSIPCIFNWCLNFYLKNREGKFLATTICPLATKNLYLSPVGARIKKLISDPVVTRNFSTGILKEEVK